MLAIAYIKSIFIVEIIHLKKTPTRIAYIGYYLPHISKLAVAFFFIYFYFLSYKNAHLSSCHLYEYSSAARERTENVNHPKAGGAVFPRP